MWQCFHIPRRSPVPSSPLFPSLSLSNFKAVAPSAEFITCLKDDKEISLLHRLK